MVISPSFISTLRRVAFKVQSDESPLIIHQHVRLIFLFCPPPQAGNYDDSIRHLEVLQEHNKDDFKISMNKAIAEFYKSGQTAIGNLKQSLMATIKSQVV